MIIDLYINALKIFTFSIKKIKNYSNENVDTYKQIWTFIEICRNRIWNAKNI